MRLKKQILKLAKVSPFEVYSFWAENKRKVEKNRTSARAVKEYLIKNDKRKIQIGCGENYLEGWLNTDIEPRNPAVYLDAGQKFNIPSESFDYIFSEHVFEHLTVEQQINMLKEGYRILKKKGIMRIATPSLDFLFKIYRNPDEPEHKKYVAWALANNFTLKSVKEEIPDNSIHYCYVINNFFKAWGHQMIHNFESIEQIAQLAGFSDLRRSEVGKSEDPVLKGLEKHGTIIPEKMNKLETMVVEIIK